MKKHYQTWPFFDVGEASLNTTTPATPDPRAIWESLTPAQRFAIGHNKAESDWAGGRKVRSVTLGTGRALASRGLVEMLSDHWACLTDLGRAVAEAGKAGA